MYAMRLLLFYFFTFFVELHCTIHFGGGKEKWTVDVVVPCVCYVFFFIACLLGCLLLGLFFGDRGRGREWKWFGKVIKGVKVISPHLSTKYPPALRSDELSLVKLRFGGRKKSRARRSQVKEFCFTYLPNCLGQTHTVKHLTIDSFFFSMRIRCGC
jgi:hypothetical protein